MAVGKLMGNLFEGDKAEVEIDGILVTRVIEKAMAEAGKPFDVKIYRFRDA